MPEKRPVRSIVDLPIALTVREAAEVLRASRNTVYGLIRLWHATGGAMGLRAVRLGRALRIAILEFLGMVPPHPGGGGFDRGTGGDRGAA